MYKLMIVYTKMLYQKSFKAWKQSHFEALEERENELIALYFWKDCMQKRFFWLLKNWKSIMPDKRDLQREYDHRTK